MVGVEWGNWNWIGEAGLGQIGHDGDDDDGNGAYDEGDNNDDVGEPDLGQSRQVRQQVAGLTIWSPWQQIIAFRKRPQNKIMGSLWF